jgi:hypothetical protein
MIALSTATSCEYHDVAGECTEDCADLVNRMNEDGYVETRIYGDYLGGSSTTDWSGCHAPEPRMERVARLDPVRKAVIWVEVCPYEDEHDATACYLCGHMGE